MMLIILGCCFIQSLYFSYELQEDSVQDFIQCSSIPLHPSGRRGILSGRRGYSIRTLSFIRDVMQKMVNRPDVRLHGPDA